MKILILTREYKNDLLPPCGGTGFFYASLAQELIGAGHDVCIFGVAKTKVRFNDNGIDVCFIKSLFKRNLLINFLRSISGKFMFLEKIHFYLHELEKKDAAKKLYKFINNKKIDIIETHDFDGLSLYLNNTIPYIIRCHGSWTVLEKYFNYKNVETGRKHCEIKAFNRAKNIITISKFSKKANEETFKLKKTKLIYNGIDTNIYTKSTDFNIIPQAIFFIGNVTIEKGADVMFESFLKITTAFRNTTLHFIGRENEKLKIDIFKRISKLRLEKQIFFYGYQPKEKVIQLLNKAHIAVFPSKGETFGLALCEVMAMQIPVVCSNIEAFNEIVVSYENGLIAKNDLDFSNKCIELFSNNNLVEKIKINSRNTILEKFSLDKMAHESILYYKKVINKN